MKKRNTILASILATTTILTTCGCAERKDDPSNDSDTSSVVSDVSTKSDKDDKESKPSDKTETIDDGNVFSDLTQISKVEDGKYSCNLSLKSGDQFSADTKFDITSNNGMVELNIPKVTLKVTPTQTDENGTVTSSAPQTITIEGINFIVDSGNKKVYVLEKSIQNFSKSFGQDMSFDHEAEWVVITPEYIKDNSDSLPEAATDIEKMKAFVNDIMPEFKDAFSPIKDKFFSKDDKHTLELNNTNVVDIYDTLIKMCDDGSMLTILKSADSIGLLDTPTVDEDTSDVTGLEAIADATSEASTNPDATTTNSTETNSDNQNDTDGNADATIGAELGTIADATTPTDIEKVDLDDLVISIKTSLEEAKKSLSADDKSKITIKTNIDDTEDNLTGTLTLALEAMGTFGDSAELVATNVDFSADITEGKNEVKIPTSTVDIDEWNEAMMEFVGNSTNTNEPPLVPPTTNE